MCVHFLASSVYMHTHKNTGRCTVTSMTKPHTSTWQLWRCSLRSPFQRNLLIQLQHLQGPLQCLSQGHTLSQAALGQQVHTARDTSAQRDAPQWGICTGTPCWAGRYFLTTGPQAEALPSHSPFTGVTPVRGSEDVPCRPLLISLLLNGTWRRKARTSKGYTLSERAD